MVANDERGFIYMYQGHTTGAMVSVSAANQTQIFLIII